MIYYESKRGVLLRYCPERKELDIIDKVSDPTNWASVYLRKEDIQELLSLLNRKDVKDDLR